MNRREAERGPQSKSDPAERKRAVKVFVWAVLALVIFNLALFAKFVIGSKTEISGKAPKPGAQTNASPDAATEP